jgi:hypothetical protein
MQYPAIGLLVNWKECGQKRSRHNLRHYLRGTIHTNIMRFSQLALLVVIAERVKMPQIIEKMYTVYKRFYRTCAGSSKVKC